jgi:predicted ribosomally synthesized peptide with SipW-like signal peptide
VEKMQKVLFSLLLIGLVAAMAGAGTLAYFFDTETSTGNTFTAGTMDLQIRDFTSAESGTWQDGVTATWTLSDMIPGTSTVFGQVELRNVGSLQADHLEITCDYTATEGAPTGDPDNVDTSANPDSFARYMEITYARYQDDLWYYDLLAGEKYTRPTTTDPWSLAATDNKWMIEDQPYQGVTDGIISLYDLKNDPLDDLTPPDGDTQFEMRLKFHQNAGNDLQGDTLDLTMIFTLNQDSSQ